MSYGRAVRGGFMIFTALAIMNSRETTTSIQGANDCNTKLSLLESKFCVEEDSYYIRLTGPPDNQSQQG